ncbi:biosynthetic-type acetolactate synthase large subunit [Lachnospiraceae bacterium C1.1]|nr:biosynthetic-type acetolactate synthase large subunit [Lachnospiraceae bacterium C1.1]
MIGADAVIKCLVKEGVDTVFGYSGVAIDPFWNSILETDIKTVLVRTEQNAAHAASGYARTRKKVGVCAVTSGPGATNLLTGIATAYADSIPLVCFTGQVDSELIGSDVFQEADVTGAAESFVKYSYLVKNVKDIPRIIHEAFYIANTGRRGPVLIDLPADIQLAHIADFKYTDEPPKLRTYKPTVKGNTLQIKKVTKVLENAKRPLVCVGGGVHLSDAEEVFRKFIEKHRIPVVSTMMGLGILPSDHPMYYGMVGNNGFQVANRAMNESDVLLMVGARVADRAVSAPDLTFEGKVLVHMDVDPAEIGKNVGPTIPIVGDAKHIFEDFMGESFYCSHEAWIASLNNYRTMVRRGDVKDTGFIDSPEFVRTLSGKMDDDAIYVADVGQNQLFSCRNYIMKKGSFFTSGGMGTMGYSIPAAIGAKMADPERQVVAVCGDGAFQMSMMELATMNQYKAPVKIVVMRNNYLGLVREHQHFTYKDNYSMVHLGSDPDLELLSKAYGINYIKCEKMENMEADIDKFLKSDESCLMEVMTDPTETVAGTIA